VCASGVTRRGFSGGKRGTAGDRHSPCHITNPRRPPRSKAHTPPPPLFPKTQTHANPHKPTQPHLVGRQVRALLARDGVVPAHHVGALGEWIVGLGLLQPPAEVGLRLLLLVVVVLGGDRDEGAAAEQRRGRERGGRVGAAAHFWDLDLGRRPCPCVPVPGGVAGVSVWMDTAMMPGHIGYPLNPGALWFGRGVVLAGRRTAGGGKGSI
jgi:hypothetical protein